MGPPAMLAVAAVAGAAWSLGGCEKPPPPRGTLHVTTTPEQGASVSIGGEEYGATPVTIEDLPLGHVIVNAEKEGYRPSWASADLSEARQEATLTIELRPLLAYLTLESEPSGAAVYVDGDGPVGRTPLLEEPVPAGTVTYELRAEGYEPAVHEVDIAPDETHKGVHKLEPEPAVLEVRSDPPGANVYINYLVQDEATPARFELKPATYAITVHMPGYVSFEKVVVYEGPNEVETIDCTLEEGNVPQGMVLVPAGPFFMGTDGGAPDERPRREVALPDYFIDKYEITNLQYQMVFPEHTFAQGEENFPVLGVSFQQAEAYAAAVGKRLPTEEEWEKAARGTDERVYPWGDTFDPERANVHTGGVRNLPEAVGTHPAGASPFGCHDMAGNAYEWTASMYRAYPGNPDIRRDYSQLFRVLRGGSYMTGSYDARCARRHYDRVQGAREDYGFRCAMDTAAYVVDEP
jgi:formylglycine-generating enzyme required for sulfatase activity